MKNRLKLFRIGRTGGTGSDSLAYVAGNIAAIEEIQRRSGSRSKAREAIRTAQTGISTSVPGTDRQTVEVKWVLGGEPGETSYSVFVDGAQQGTVWGSSPEDAKLRAWAIYGSTAVTHSDQMEPPGVST